MLMGSKNDDFVRYNESEKLVAVRRGSPQWAGWVNWYFHEFGKQFFPDWLTVPFEWPPTSQDGADIAAKWLSDIRDSRPAKGGPISTTPVPSHPRPWNGAKNLPASPPCSYPGVVKEAMKAQAE